MTHPTHLRACLATNRAHSQTSGNDIFFRNPFNVDENLFVDVSSPSSSKYESVEDLGTPDQAAQRTVGQVRRSEAARGGAVWQRGGGTCQRKTGDLTYAPRHQEVSKSYSCLLCPHPTSHS